MRKTDEMLRKEKVMWFGKHIKLYILTEGRGGKSTVPDVKSQDVR